jgi:hypothetical protein
MPDPKPVAEKETIPVKVEEPSINNNFYNRLGILYCSKCGERKRTINGTTPFCPIAKPNCPGF